jgi:hypothetical protein
METNGRIEHPVREWSRAEICHHLHRPAVRQWIEIDSYVEPVSRVLQKPGHTAGRRDLENVSRRSDRLVKRGYEEAEIPVSFQ